MKEKLKQYCDLSYKMNKEKNDDIKSDLNNILLELKQEAMMKFEKESDIKKFLDNVCYFNNYSYNNQLLIYMQNINATYVTSFNKISEMGYKVNKAEEGIKILIPSFLRLVKIKASGNEEIKLYKDLTKEEMKKYRNQFDQEIIFHKDILTHFKIGTVFDISQTNMPITEIKNELDPILENSSADDIINIFIKTIYRDGYKIEFKNIDNGSKGYCNHQNKVITIREGPSNLMKLKVLVHEYAHSLAHYHLENNNKEYQNNRNKYETEAEGIAYVVCKYLGLDTMNYSVNYLYAWSKEKNFVEIDNSLEIIVKESNKIINNFKKMNEKEYDLYDQKTLN